VISIMQTGSSAMGSLLVHLDGYSGGKGRASADSCRNTEFSTVEAPCRQVKSPRRPCKFRMTV